MSISGPWRPASRIMVLIALYGNKPNCSNKIPNMLVYLQEHTARGNSLAQYYLGYAHDIGHFGAQRDSKRAFDLYMLAAQQGNAHAPMLRGNLLRLWVGRRTRR